MRLPACNRVEGWFFLPPGLLAADFALPGYLEVPDAETAHHLRTVMRLKPGAEVVAVDGEREVAYRAVLASLEKSGFRLQLETALPVKTPTLPHVTLAASLIKEQRWDWLLQKATELGVRRIQPLMTDHAVIRLEARDFEKKRRRWQAIAQAAAGQSEGLFIPKVLPPCPLADLAPAPGETGLLLQERGENRPLLREVLRALPHATPLVLAIGPEGGWSEGEVSRLVSTGFQPVSLGSRVLRAETAAMAALAAVMYESEA